ncbi:hypothetical protein ElyMa_000237700 [Elysia marginata]|uniref:Fibrinogen C-terminal domain-containing protein n=1 Tax=Elysia marginata TaxID=1093978 RepID=A0AAV4F1L3_9GAST|nr:hypothetical protein ElyMa_000237700 [Elysia marginata]
MTLESINPRYRLSVPKPPTYLSKGNFGSAYTLTDIFGPVQNTPFSTADKDGDSNTSDNCAALAGAGWWFKSCNTWTSTGTDRINPLGWTAEAKPNNTGSDFRDLLGLPGLNFEDDEMKGSFLVINAYFYQEPPKSG